MFPIIGTITNTSYSVHLLLENRSHSIPGKYINMTIFSFSIVSYKIYNLSKIGLFQHLTSISDYQGSSLIATTKIIANMKKIIFLLFAVCLQDNLITRIESKVIQNNDEKTMKSDVGAKNQLSLRSRGKGRIIGGNEIKPHSQPWLALLCSTNVKEKW